MLVVYNSVILRNGFLSVMTQDMHDTLVLPSSSFNLLCQFFIMQSFLYSDCYDELAILEDDFDILEDKLFYRNQFITGKVWNVAPVDMLVLRGILLKVLPNCHDSFFPLRRWIGGYKGVCICGHIL